MPKLIKKWYSYTIYCQFCGRATRNEYSNSFYCSVECKIAGMINRGDFLIGDPYLIKLRRS